MSSWRPWPAARLIVAGTLGCWLWTMIFLRQITVHAYGQFWFLPLEVLAAADAAVAMGGRLSSRPRLRRVLAGAAVAITLASAAQLLHYRYTHPGSFAVRTSAANSERYFTSPWE